jgi:hypothetical protein
MSLKEALTPPCRVKAASDSGRASADMAGGRASYEAAVELFLG